MTQLNAVVSHFKVMEGLNSGTTINTLQSHQTEFANFHTLAYANLEACREFEYNLEDADLGERLS